MLAWFHKGNLMNKKGFFISIEGVEGVGKSTAMDFLRQQLDMAEIQYVQTREPGGTPIAEEIRQVLLSSYNEIMHPDTELLLMFAARAQNIAHVIMPALQRGHWIISDRFTDASFAYQGAGRGVSARHITELASWVQGDLCPDLTLLLDTPVNVGFSRIQKRGVKDRIENEGEEFFERVRQCYLERAQQYPERIRIIKADQPLKNVQQQILDVLMPVISEHA